MDGIDDRELRVPYKGLDGQRLQGKEVLAIRQKVRQSDAGTDAEIDAFIHAELKSLQDRKLAPA